MVEDKFFHAPKVDIFVNPWQQWISARNQLTLSGGQARAVSRVLFLPLLAGKVRMGGEISVAYRDPDLGTEPIGRAVDLQRRQVAVCQLQPLSNVVEGYPVAARLDR